jgi:hypothetical protein
MKFTKQFLMLCLIVLQFAAPFIHAHAFGHDSFKAQIFHLHTDEISNFNTDNGSFSQAQLYDHEVVGAITTVSSGIKTSMADDIADGIAVLAILFTFAPMVFNVPGKFSWPTRLFLPAKQLSYAHQNPRAPPR